MNKTVIIGGHLRVAVLVVLVVYSSIHSRLLVRRRCVDLGQDLGSRFFFLTDTRSTPFELLNRMHVP